MKRLLCIVAALAAVVLAGCSTAATREEIDQIYIGSPKVTAWYEGVLVKVDEYRESTPLIDAAGVALPTHGVLGGVGAVINTTSLLAPLPIRYTLHIQKADGEIVALPPLQYTETKKFNVGDTYRVLYAEETLKFNLPVNITKYPKLAVKTGPREGEKVAR